jgi:glycosyltransferase involved in cell wall biosynthesis
MPRVSVILPTCDRPALLKRAVDSVLGQSERDLELLVVDNNRTTAPLGAAGAPEWAADPRVTVVRAASAANAGAARNVGLDAARGEWIAFLDDDDAFRAEKLRRQIEGAGPSPVVLCGALYHVCGRERLVQVSARSFSGDQLLCEARWGAPFLMHRRADGVRHDEDLFAGEDAHYAHRLLVRFGLREVPVVGIPLIDVYQDRPGASRTNTRGEALWGASRRVLAQFGPRYSRSARRLYLLRAMVIRAKLAGRPLACAALATKLLRAGGLSQARFAANAFAVAVGLGRGRWVT